MDETLEAPPALAAKSALIAPYPGTPEWHAQRATVLGGSDMAAVMSLSKWATPFEIFLMKRGELAPKESNEWMEWGHRLEAPILTAYTERTGREVVRPRAMLRHAVHKFMGGNPDAFTVVGDRVVEVKTAYDTTGWGEPGTDEVPDPYNIQCQHYMFLTGITLCDVVVLFHGSRLAIYTLRADPELQALQLEAGRGFWQCVLENRPPEVHTLDDIRLRYGHMKAEGRLIATDSQVEMVHMLRDARQQMADLQATEDDIKGKLMVTLGERADTLMGPEGKPLITWKLAAGAMRFDLERFKVDHPRLHGQYLREGKGSRRFLIK